MLSKTSCQALTAFPQRRFKFRTGRRRFLLDCSVLAASAVLAPLTAWASSRALRQVSLSALSQAAFAEQLHTVFLVRLTDGRVVELELKKVESSLPDTSPGRRFPGVRWESFSLVFGGAQDAFLPQETYEFEHAALGRFSLFIVPIGVPEDNEQRYQAIFTQLHRRSAQEAEPVLRQRSYE
jgi:hypothetical protein